MKETENKEKADKLGLCTVKHKFLKISVDLRIELAAETHKL
jgi:hypothetical protein